MSRIEYKVKKCIKIKGEKYVRLYSSLDNIEFLITHNIINFLCGDIRTKEC